MRILAAIAVLLFAAYTSAAEAGDAGGWKAGAAAARITPDKPVVLFGYPDRVGVSTKVEQDIWAKAVALEDPAGHRAVIVTADLFGFTAQHITDPVCQRLEKLTGLPRERFIFNASNTHTAPVVSLKPWRTQNVVHPAISEIDAQQTAAYTGSLQGKLIGVALEALKGLAPATLAYGTGEIDAAATKGRIDRTVPLLRVTGGDGKLRAVLFGCAARNMAMGSANVIHGDYAGVAQAALEEAHPGAIALFMAGCNADAEPPAAGSIDLAKPQGQSLFKEVDRVLAADLVPIQGNLSTQFAKVELPLLDLNREKLKPYLALGNLQARQAQHMMTLLDAGESPIKGYEAPIAVWQLGDRLTLVALPGQPSAGYVPLLVMALGGKNVWLSGNNNDSFGSIPIAANVKEIGPEAHGVTLWTFGQDLGRSVGFFSPPVQEVVLSTVVNLTGKGLGNRQ
jgi:neutral ceramidase